MARGCDPIFHLPGDPPDLSPEKARKLYEERLRRIEEVVARHGWVVAQRACKVFSAKRVNPPNGVSVESLRYALSQEGLIEVEPPTITTVTSSPGQPVQLSEDQGLENRETEDPVDHSVSDDFDLGNWR